MCFGGGSSSQPAPRKVEVPNVPAGPNVITSEVIEGPNKIEPAGSSTATTTSSSTGLNIPNKGY